jgi:phosphotransferase system  glucose/maltose/N-acetylglucosamine-specific IIC component
MHLAGVPIQNTLKILFMNLMVFLPAAIIMSVAKIINVNSGIQIILATLLLILYFVYLLKTDSSLREMVRNFGLIKRV